jgi:uncharacterized membrane protein
MSLLSHPRAPRDLDPSARAGVMLAAVSVGLSYQPNLLTRRSLDQGIISGISGLAGYSWGVSAHSALSSLGARVGGRRGQVVGDALVVAGAIAANRLLAWREHEPTWRAVARLGAGSLAGAAATGMASRSIEAIPRTSIRLAATTASVAALGGGVYLATRLFGQQVGALELGPFRSDRGSDIADDVDRTVDPVVATGIGIAVTGTLLAVATAESRLTRLWSRGVSSLFGGRPEDHATAARVLSTMATVTVGALALKFVDRELGNAGEGMELAHATPPDIPEITGSPVSGRAWADQSREGRRWLSMVLPPETISSVMNEPAKQPIRVYASLSSATTEEGRAQVLLDEIDRTRALERPYVALWSPTGSGYVNYVACETFEYLTRGDCASLAIQYSVLPSSLSLADVRRGTNQTRMVFAGIAQRLREMDPKDHPRFFLFGESLGSQVSEDMFDGMGVFGPESLGLEAALWIGTPEATKWRQQLWGDRSVANVPAVGPGSIYMPRWVGDWTQLDAEDRQRVRYLLLQNGDDPIPKFWFELLWHRPAWLGPWGKRPPGAPRHTIWWPVTTFFSTFMDVLNALAPTPGVFVEGGHDYRLELPETLREVWRLSATEPQMASVQSALRRRELGWETKRRWMEAEAVVGPEQRKAAETKVLDDVATWTGRPSVTPPDVVRIIDENCEPSGPVTSQIATSPSSVAQEAREELGSTGGSSGS